MKEKEINKKLVQYIINFNNVVTPYYGKENFALKIKESIIKVDNIFKRCKIT